MVVVMKVLHQLLLEVGISHQQTQELLMLLNMVIVVVLVEVALIVAVEVVEVPEELAPIVLLVNQQDLVGLEEQMTMLMDQQIQ